jgi:hypothetical protein
MRDAKKFMKVTLMTAMFVLGATSLTSTNTYAATQSNVESRALGGWDEETGYFKNVSAYNSKMLLDNVSASNAKHTGKRERNDDESTTRYRAHGWTTWVGKYHYTRARMEAGKKVLEDSGRVWGQDGTEAISPWHYWDPDINDKARTYYGS